MRILVRLDNPAMPAGPATVIGIGSVSIPEDRDGARDENMRIWRGYPGVAPGDRVALGPR